MEDTKKTRPTRYDRVDAHKNSHTVEAQSRLEQIQAKQGPSTKRGCGHKSISLTQKLSPTDNNSQKKNYFSPTESHWVYKSYLRTHPMPGTRQSIQNELNVIFGGFLFHYALSELFFNLTGSCLYIMISSLMFLWVSVFLNVCLHAYKCFVCSFFGSFICLFFPILFF